MSGQKHVTFSPPVPRVNYAALARAAEAEAAARERERARRIEALRDCLNTARRQAKADADAVAASPWALEEEKAAVSQTLRELSALKIGSSEPEAQQASSLGAELRRSIHEWAERGQLRQKTHSGLSDLESSLQRLALPAILGQRREDLTKLLRLAQGEVRSAPMDSVSAQQWRERVRGLADALNILSTAAQQWTDFDTFVTTLAERSYASEAVRTAWKQRVDQAAVDSPAEVPAIIEAIVLEAQTLFMKEKNDAPLEEMRRRREASQQRTAAHGELNVLENQLTDIYHTGVHRERVMAADGLARKVRQKLADLDLGDATVALTTLRAELQWLRENPGSATVQRPSQRDIRRDEVAQEIADDRHRIEELARVLRQTGRSGMSGIEFSEFEVETALEGLSRDATTCLKGRLRGTTQEAWITIGFRDDEIFMEPTHDADNAADEVVCLGFASFGKEFEAQAGGHARFHMEKEERRERRASQTTTSTRNTQV